MSKLKIIGCVALLASVITPAWAGTGTAQFYGVTNTNGSLIRGSGIISSAKTSLGNYKMVFARTLAGCVWVVDSRASVGLTNTTSVAGQPEALIVQTFTSGGNPVDKPVNIFVYCQD